MTAAGMRCLLATMNCTSDQSCDIRAAAARSAEEGQLHGAGVDRMKCGSQVRDELIGAGKADLGIVDAEGGHVLKKADGIGHRDVDVRLLQPVAETCVEEFDSYRFKFLHFFPHSLVKISMAIDPEQADSSYRGAAFQPRFFPPGLLPKRLPPEGGPERLGPVGLPL